MLMISHRTGPYASCVPKVCRALALKIDQLKYMRALCGVAHVIYHNKVVTICMFKIVSIRHTLFLEEGVVQTTGPEMERASPSE